MKKDFLLWPVVKGNSFKTTRQFRLDIRNKFLMRVARHWNRLPTAGRLELGDL